MYLSYKDIAQSWGYGEPFYMEPFGDYQGDYLVVVQDGNRFGVVTIGYGSCSGCDTLQALEDYDSEDGWNDALRDFAQSLKDGIDWYDTAKDLAQHFRDEAVQEGRYSWYYADFRTAVATLADTLDSLGHVTYIPKHMKKE